ncbi:hypothetical protein [Thermomonospora amylolytica]|uniref:hypothetical protein n=1 Tax=Thermomonospora amylolytica TaxID=1411117 RepID=UPI00389B1037
MCGWSGTSFTGTMTTFSAGAGCLNSPIPLRSVANTYGFGFMAVMNVYSGPNCTGTLLATVRPGDSVPFLFSWGSSVHTVI